MLILKDDKDEISLVYEIFPKVSIHFTVHIFTVHYCSVIVESQNFYLNCHELAMLILH